MENKDYYNDRFYEDSDLGSITAAKVVLPILFETWRPASLIDVGCGLGSWSAAALKLGVPLCLGVDGAHVNMDSLQISPTMFLAHNLELPLPQNLSAEMAICIEVAEHLSPQRAGGLVSDLCRIAPIVLFSGAVPYQGGTGHINENWPEYWAALFARCGYQPYDIIRDRIWSLASVPWWYRQNLLLFAQPNFARDRLGLAQPSPPASLARIHPEQFLLAVHRQRMMATRRLDEDRAHYRQSVAGEIVEAGYGSEFDIRF